MSHTPPDPSAPYAPAPPPGKVKKPWYKRPLPLIGLLVLVIIVISVAAGGGGDDKEPTATTASDESTSSAPEPSATPSKSKKAEPKQPEGTLPQEDGDWRLDSVKLENSLGDFSGTARITYTGDDDDATNIFTITVLTKNGDVVASLDGSAEGMSNGGTETVQLISTDKWQKGDWKYFDFQKGL
jgi:hypothetical protein